MCKEEGTETWRRKNRGAEEKRSYKKQKKKPESIYLFLLIRLERPRWIELELMALLHGTIATFSFPHLLTLFPSLCQIRHLRAVFNLRGITLASNLLF